jgi:hypothetical protein
MKWCNAKSEKEGLTPVYLTGSGDVYRTGDNFPYGPIFGKVNRSAKGYRLPTLMEHEWAARGGAIGVNNRYKYSGGNDLNSVAWFWDNTSGFSKAVGTKLPNELGIYDMSGNVSEWCEASPNLPFMNRIGLPLGGSYREVRGLGFFDSFMGETERSSSIGFRLARKWGK